MAASPAAGPLAAAGRVLLFDGVCSLCNSCVSFIIRRDPAKRILFCSVQSPKAEPYLRSLGITRADALKRLIFIQEDHWSEGSTAALEVAGFMRPPWPLLKGLLLVPLPLRERVYDAVAASRYRIWGRTARCQVPSTDVLDRFLDAEDLVMGRCKDVALDANAFEQERKARSKE